jgi:hypothetical protein
MIKQLDLYLHKIVKHSVKESWVIDNLGDLHNFICANYIGETFSEKVYKHINSIENVCKGCGGTTKFLSFNRGYSTFCSKKCSNNDLDSINNKLLSFKSNNLIKYGVENTSMLEATKYKLRMSKSGMTYDEINIKSKKTFMDKLGVDNPSKLDSIKEKKKETFNKKWGVDNPFKSDDVKEKIKRTLFIKYGVEHPLKCDIIKEKRKETLLLKYGVDNYTKSDEYKEKIYKNYKNGLIETTVNKDINFLDYLGAGIYKLRCDTSEHTYNIHRHTYHSRRRIGSKKCLVCNPLNSLQSVNELKLYNFIKSNYHGDIIKSYRDGLEIDVYLPELNIGFEFNGLYWHSEKFKDKDYHLNKTNYFKEKGIRIIHIWEDDWFYKKDILESQIKNWLNLTEYKIFARKCEIRNVLDNKLIRKFLDDNHIQGHVASNIKIGLFYDNELVSLMTFDKNEGRKKMPTDEWNLSRFCNKTNTNIIGAASKLLNYFIKEHKPVRIISFADKEWSDGNLYFKLGFYLKFVSKPNYKYLINNKRCNKQKYQKKRLVGNGFNPESSETEIMRDLGNYKIFDCGQLKFEFIIRNFISL